ncbi:MAG: hypothetical protein SF051_13010 [Elusimicrobiota bacterium]|nr:hypothetical protein [Elusimicrobiota bacterium]
MILALLAVLLAPAAHAAAPAVSTAAPAAVSATTHTVASLYTGDRGRDPFLPASSGGRAPARVDLDAPQGPPTADIHALTLRGILKDRSADFAIFAAESGETFMLRAGRLYNERNKPVPGITGRINLKQKRVELMTADKDVQTFVIGETNKEKDEEQRP